MTVNSMTSGLCRVRERAKKDKGVRFTALMHHIDLKLMWDSFHELRRNAAPGVDGVCLKEYEANLLGNLTGLCLIVL